MLARSAARFLDTTQALTDDDLRRGSALPGWTRGHVRQYWPGCLVAATAAACTQIPPPCRPSRHWPYRSFQQPPGSQLDLRFRQQDVRGGIA